MSQKIYTDLDVKSSVTISTINNATTDTDKFLVSDGGIIKYRTGAELLSDIGITGGYVPYTGATGNVDLGTHTLSSYNLIVNHTSGSGVAASITKGGSGEALTINKTSGSGNAMSVTGGLTSLVDLTLSSIPNATTDTDRFIVSDSGTIKYRTGEQTLSDLGACKVVNLTVGTASATVTKVTTESVIFEEGVLYLIKFTSGNIASSPTLNGRNIRLGTSNVSTTTFSIGTNTIVPMYYNATNNVMQITGSYRTSDSTEDYNLRWENSVQAGETITRYKIIMEGIDGRFYPLTIENTTAATKTVSTQEFRLDGTILVYNSTTTIAANAVFTNVYVSEYFTTTNYTFNQSSGFTAYRSVYLVGTINSNGNFVLDNTTLTSWLTQTLPTTDDGKVYIYLGITNNTTTAFRLEVTHPIYQYKNGKLGLYSSIENPITGTGTTNYISKFTGSTTLGNSLLFDNGTNVGINTTSPDQKLHVNGATQLGDINATTNFGTVALKVIEGTVSTGPTLGSGTVGAQAVLYSNGAFGMYTGVNGITGNTWMQSQRNDGNTAVYSLLFQPSGGNVGIGTSSPVAKLDIGGASGEMIRLADSSTIGNPFISFFQTSTRRSYIQHVDSGDNLTLASEYGGIVLMTGTSGTETEKMRITSSGEVGIGTSILGAPSYGSTPQLTVASPTGGVMDLRSSDTDIVANDRFGRLQFSGKDDNSVAYATAAIEAIAASTTGSGSGGGGVLKFMTATPGVPNSPLERMRITSGGMVGIGTTEPSYPLDVNGTAMLRSALYMTAGGTSPVPNWYFQINGSGDLVVDEAVTTQNFIFSNSGQVLIGTTVGGTPAYGSAPQFVTASATGGVIDIRSLNTNIVANSLLGRIQFTGKDDSTVGYTSAAIEAVSAGTTNSGFNGGGTLKFMTSSQGYSTNPLPRMWISYLGYVTIGSTNTNSYPLRVTTQVSNTSIYADYDIVAYSDQSVKENIRPIENVIERVQKSRGVLYDRIDSESKDNIGFIAQELEVAFPELVVTNEDGTKAVKYQNAVAVMFEAIKEQQKQIDELKELITKLIK